VEVKQRRANGQRLRIGGAALSVVEPKLSRRVLLLF
jgi:hypothetical protein